MLTTLLHLLHLTDVSDLVQLHPCLSGRDNKELLKWQFERHWSSIDANPEKGSLHRHDRPINPLTYSTSRPKTWRDFKFNISYLRFPLLCGNITLLLRCSCYFSAFATLHEHLSSITSPSTSGSDVTRARDCVAVIVEVIKPALSKNLAILPSQFSVFCLTLY